MHVTFRRIGDDHDLIYLRITGKASVAGFRAAMVPIFQNPDYQSSLPELADLSGVLPGDLRFPEMHKLATTASEAAPESGKKRICLYTPHETGFGMARMFSSMADTMPNVVTFACQTEAEALAWLGRAEQRFQDIKGYTEAHNAPVVPPAADSL